MGVWPKKTNGALLIMDLSRPLEASVNVHLDKVAYSTRYSSLKGATITVTVKGPGTLMAKLYLKHAFRLIPVRRTVQTSPATNLMANLSGRGSTIQLAVLISYI